MRTDNQTGATAVTRNVRLLEQPFRVLSPAAGTRCPRLLFAGGLADFISSAFLRILAHFHFRTSFLGTNPVFIRASAALIIFSHLITALAWRRVLSSLLRALPFGYRTVTVHFTIYCIHRVLTFSSRSSRVHFFTSCILS